MAAAPLSVNGIELFELPKEKTVLWDHTACGRSVKVHFSQHQMPKVHLKISMLQQALKKLDMTKKDKSFCQITGSVTASTGPSSVGVSITLNQLEDFNCSRNLGYGEIAAMVALIRKNKAAFQWDMEQYFSDLKEINARCSAYQLDLARFLKPRIICSFGSVQCDVKVEVAAIATSFTLTPICSVPVHSTALSQSMCESRELTQHTGFLTLDREKQVVLLPETEPNLTKLPLVGIWVSGVSTVLHPLIWAACVRYISSVLYKKRLCLPPLPFLLVVYHPETYVPTFHDCICESGNSWPIFACYEGAACADLPKVPVVESRLLFIDLNRVYAKNSKFSEADKQIERNEIQKGPAVITSNTEDIPQLRYKPPEKFKVIVDPTPLAPNLSLLKDCGNSHLTAARINANPSSHWLSQPQRFPNSHMNNSEPPPIYCAKPHSSDGFVSNVLSTNNSTYPQHYNDMHLQTMAKSVTMNSDQNCYSCQQTVVETRQPSCPNTVCQGNTYAQNTSKGICLETSEPNNLNRLSLQNMKQVCVELPSTVQPLIQQFPGHVDPLMQQFQNPPGYLNSAHHFTDNEVSCHLPSRNSSLGFATASKTDGYQHMQSVVPSSNPVPSSVHNITSRCSFARPSEENHVTTEILNTESNTLQNLSSTLSDSESLRAPETLSNARFNSLSKSISTVAKSSAVPLKSCLKNSSTLRGQNQTSVRAGQLSDKNTSNQKSFSTGRKTMTSKPALTSGVKQKSNVKALPKGKSAIPVRVKNTGIENADAKEGKIDNTLLQMIKTQNDVLSTVQSTLAQLLQQKDTDSLKAADSVCEVITHNSEAKSSLKPASKGQKPSSANYSDAPRKSFNSTNTHSPQPSNSSRACYKNEGMAQAEINLTALEQEISNCEESVPPSSCEAKHVSTVRNEPDFVALSGAPSGYIKSGSSSSRNSKNQSSPNVSLANSHPKTSSSNVSHSVFYRETCSVPTMTSFLSVEEVHQVHHNANSLSKLQKRDIGVGCSGLGTWEKHRSDPVSVKGPDVHKRSHGDCLISSSSDDVPEAQTLNRDHPALTSVPNSRSSCHNKLPVQVELEDYPESVECSEAEDSDCEDCAPQQHHFEKEEDVKKNSVCCKIYPPNPSRGNHPCHDHHWANAQVNHNHYIQHPKCCKGRTEHVSILQRSCVIRTTENCGHNYFGANKKMSMASHYLTHSDSSCSCCEHKKNSIHKFSDLTYYGMTTPNATIATKQYLQKFDLVPSEEELRRLCTKKESSVLGQHGSHLQNERSLLWTFEEHHRYPRNLESIV